MKIKHKCKDNGVDLIFQIEDNKIDEIWVGLKKDYYVIGFNDLKKGIKKVNKKLNKLKHE